MGFTYLEYIISTPQEKAHMWLCQKCELFILCEDNECFKCGSKSPYVDDNCPGCYADWEVRSAYEIIGRKYLPSNRPKNERSDRRK
jgi:hypothetical protein